MSRESEVAAVLLADATLDTILTGGVYTDEALGIEGIRRGSATVGDEDYSPTAAAFDANDWLLPCALVKQRGKVPFGDLRDLRDKKASAGQVVEVWLYQDRGHNSIDAAKERIYLLLEGYSFTNAYPARWAMDTPHVPDMGALKRSTVIRTDYQIIDIKGS